MTQPCTPPPIESAADPIHCAADMGDRWRALMGPLGFGQRLLWVGFVGPDRCMLKVLTDMPLGPRPRRSAIEPMFCALVDALADFIPDTTVALLLTRPGTGPISAADRQWATLLTEVAGELGLPIEPVFRANDEALEQVEPGLRAVG